MVRGYAKALYFLGRRYETGLGSWNNPDEAYRCFMKAARLGSPAAAAKIGARAVAAESEAFTLPPIARLAQDPPSSRTE